MGWQEELMAGHTRGVGSRREYLCHIGKQCRNLLSQRTCKVVSKYCTKRWCLVRISTGDTGDARIFPMRNRIISALSDGVLIVEAREKSGSLITAELALEQGKDIFVIPGRIGDTLSEGCNQWIRQGAYLVTKPSDIVEYYEANGLLARRKNRKI